jgi:diadenosine tetraphosphatase ApaH/serine/threonine PP2A family protein phosphatase
VDQTLCGGDFVGYYSNPNETIELIRSLDCWKSVMGNHDSALLGLTSMDKFNKPAAEAIAWTQSRIKPENRNYLATLRLREEIGEIQLVHSSPFQSEEWHYLTSQEDLERNFRYFQGFICFFGHVHKPFVAEQQKDGSVKIIEDQDYQLRPECRYLVNLGSVGQPRDGSPKTSWVLYDSTAKTLSIKRLDYDIETTAKKTLDAGLPEYLAQRLKTGK